MPGLVPVVAIPEDRPSKRRPKRRKPNPDTVPVWARELADQVCRDFGKPKVTIRWRYRRDPSRRGFDETSGTTWTPSDGKPKWISILAGIDVVGQRVTLLHELAHYILPNKQGHTKRFWALCWLLFERYDANLYKAYQQSTGYKRKAELYCPDHILDQMKNYIGKGE